MKAKIFFMLFTATIALHNADLNGTKRKHSPNDDLIESAQENPTRNKASKKTERKKQKKNIPCIKKVHSFNCLGQHTPLFPEKPLSQEPKKIGVRKKQKINTLSTIVSLPKHPAQPTNLVTNSPAIQLDPYINFYLQTARIYYRGHLPTLNSAFQKKIIKPLSSFCTSLPLDMQKAQTLLEDAVLLGHETIVIALLANEYLKAQNWLDDTALTRVLLFTGNNKTIQELFKPALEKFKKNSKHRKNTKSTPIK